MQCSLVYNLSRNFLQEGDTSCMKHCAPCNGQTVVAGLVAATALLSAKYAETLPCLKQICSLSSMFVSSNLTLTYFSAKMHS